MIACVLWARWWPEFPIHLATGTAIRKVSWGWGPLALKVLAAPPSGATGIGTGRGIERQIGFYPRGPVASVAAISDPLPLSLRPCPHPVKFDPAS
jgi:hypothetical protein